MTPQQHAMRGAAAKTLEEWIAMWSSWPRRTAEILRDAVAGAAEFEPRIKWGNLLFNANGPAVLIHVEDHRVILGFLRGKRLTGIEPAIKCSGKYELGNLFYGPDSEVDVAQVARLAAEAARLNRELGDPTKAA